MRFVEACIFKI